MKVVYLAGPYRSDSEWCVHRNIEAAGQIALTIWMLGAVCICPHKNSSHFGGAMPDATWLEGDRELIRRSDAILMMKNWSESIGASGEKTFAEQLGKPVLFSLDELRDWLTKETR